MSTSHVPIPAGRTYITDGGLETTLVFHDGIDLPDFAAFPLLDDEAGRATLARYYTPYLDIAERDRVGIVLDTPTWRANPDWAARLGRDLAALADVNRRAVEYARTIGRSRPDVEHVVNGVVGPRGDGYAIGEVMSPSEAASYHSLQLRAFADAGVDMVSAVTMTHVEEAIGITLAAVDVGLPAVISFTVEIDGSLPSGTKLGDAIDAVDAATDGAPAYYMVNCAHPDHFESVLDEDAAWLGRIMAVRANASRMSHEELDEAEELDRGDVAELAGVYVRLQQIIPDLRVVGGCCGTDHEHVSAISAAVAR